MSELGAATGLVMMAIAVGSHLLAWTREEQVQSWLQKLFPADSSLASLFAAFVASGSLVYLCFIVRRRCSMSLASDDSASTGGTPDRVPSERDGLFGALRRAIDRALASQRKAREESSEARPDPPDTERLIREILPEAVVRGGQDLAKRSPPPTGPANLSFLFAGHRPTRAQGDVLEAFWRLYAATFTNLARGPGDRNCDILVYGPAHSGRTTVLCACALDAVIRRGQHVVMIVPTRRDVKRLVAVCRKQLDFTSLGPYLTVESLTETLATQLAKDSLLPHILVTTLDEFQRLLLDNPRSRVRELCRLFECVLVDDYDRFSSAERSHVVFVLDKMRWMIEDSWRVFQAVLGCGDLSQAGREFVCSRLATSTFASDQCIRLDPLMLPPVRVVHTRKPLDEALVDTFHTRFSNVGVAFAALRVHEDGDFELVKAAPAAECIEAEDNAASSRESYDVLMILGSVQPETLNRARAQYANPDSVIVGYVAGPLESLPVLPIAAPRHAP
ncbi:MAG TPA: hypothetical protein ENJ50_02090, partial [Planctomycetaceae bacterium]|nr:hypothetical protein [Planctomycetaceae bacterium]